MKPHIIIITGIVLLVSVFISSCKSSVKRTPKTIVSSIHAFNVINTIDHYFRTYNNRTKLIIDSPASVLYIAKVNDVQIALIGFEDSVIKVFTYQNMSWQLMDSATDFFNVWTINEVDLNGDKLKDLRLMFPVMRGNFVCQVLLYDSLKKGFYFNKYYSKMNIGYDIKTGLVHSCGLGGIYDNSKELYRIVGDSLIFYKGVNESISGTEKYGNYLSIYENRNNQRKLVRTIKGTANYINSCFESELWTDKYLDYFFADNTQWDEL